MEIQILEPGEPTLGELADIANSEHALVIEAGVSMVEHAIRAGEALSKAKRLCPTGEWKRWCEANFVATYGTAHGYVRVFDHKDKIRAELVEPTLGEALRHVRGLPPAQDLRGANLRGSDKDERKARAREMRDAGCSYQEIADHFGVGRDTVRRWIDRAARESLNAGLRRRAARQRAARKALARQERDAAMRRIKGPVSEAYALIRRTAQALDQARGSADDPELRAALNSALTRLHSSEDEIVRALGIEGGQRGVGIAA